MNNAHPPYWFHAKRHGWGWGLPANLQGWTFFIVWMIIVMAASPILALRSIPLFIAFMVVMSAGLIAICYIKGEPPRWR
jgi:hypothetical protein